MPTPEAARTVVRTNATVIRRSGGPARRGRCADLRARRPLHPPPARYSQIIGKRDGRAGSFRALPADLPAWRHLFLTDTYVSEDPSAEEIAETTIMAAQEIRRFGITPKAALVSHVEFRLARFRQRRKMREALSIIRSMAPDLEVDGEMHGDSPSAKPCASG
jgi:malate dehydrogenase (oxaloacetate-decarboxylating)(NADP+)